ncbi:MAG: sporulation initiation factor Spo0A C-terminal domain-containing protein [Oscillospiraceae bacterium]|jgi:two-component system response regulator (stage 0 sporulation protein A)|nr:sporulation initiation factor Spo0A C-terminal domain-containing protein [Oscillospiraceae bacterium]MCI2034796.1 sporulation initiation factor Spo0A C-terminal domain-containing protein [Oscillospiraceae bacterium]
MNAEIVELLRRVGVPAHVLGYTYLKDAIRLCLNDGTYIREIIKRLYPAIAKRENSTASRVEKAIRHAIEISWNGSDPEVYKSLFGPVLHHPPNSEFIATLTEQLRLEQGAAAE